MPAYNVVNPGSMVFGQPEDVSQVLANFQAIAALVNGNLDDYNIKPSAGIQSSKIQGGTPMPAVEGQWIKGVGGLPVWSTIGAADVKQVSQGYLGGSVVLADPGTNPPGTFGSVMTIPLTPKFPWAGDDRYVLIAGSLNIGSAGGAAPFGYYGFGGQAGAPGFQQNYAVPANTQVDFAVCRVVGLKQSHFPLTVGINSNANFTRGNWVIACVDLGPV
jgi:hypothetical protein